VDETHALQIHETLFEAMRSPSFYPHPVTSVQVQETHISRVFLTGGLVYKIKKPVDLGFLDFTSLEKRKHFCLREIALNKRLAPDVYLETVAITYDGRRFHLNGSGDVIEYAVKMRQLPENRSMQQLLKRHEILPEDMDALAELLNRFYENAETGNRIQDMGAFETVRSNWEENFSQTARYAGDLIDERKFQIVRAVVRSFLHRRRSLFQRRIDEGKIRDCHGDLRTGHIYFFEGIKIIDCIEFNDRFRYSDTAMDLAFLTMDLDFEGAAELGNRFLDTYVRCSGDWDLFVLIDFYKSYRAFVRCKVNCFQATETDAGEGKRQQLIRDANRFLGLAYEYSVLFSKPTLWIVCGMPASGKSTIACALSETLQAPLYQSDRIRKALFQVPEGQRRDTGFENDIYSSGATSLTYGKLILHAQEDLKKGCSVILDATFSHERHRDEALRLAHDMDVNVVFVECRAPVDLLKHRLEKRELVDSLSDARAHHLPHFLKRFESLDDIRDEMHILVDTSNSVETCVKHILSQDYILHSQ
jgi:hypothetical protein